jgi:hypothetical protein
MGKNMGPPKKGIHVFALTFFCPNKIALDSRYIIEP